MTRSFTSTSSIPALLKEDFATANYTSFPVDLLNVRVHDAVQTTLPATAATDDLGITGTAAVYLTTGDVMNTSITRRARVMASCPSQYVDGDPIKVAIYAKILDATAAVSATVDLEAYLEDDTTVATADICSTATQNCNSITMAAYYFTLNPATLGAGDRLNLRLSLIVNDTGGGDACTAVIAGVYVQCNTKGT